MRHKTLRWGLLKQLGKTKPSARSLFEKHVFDTKCLYDKLAEFSRVVPPCLLWRGAGKFEGLFIFLAPRFLMCPDHVLDCDRIHARWKWSCDQKRGLKMYTLNAILRATRLLESNHMPTDQQLYEDLEAERALHDSELAHAADDDIAIGWRSALGHIGPSPIGTSPLCR